MLVGQHWHVHLREFTIEHRLRVYTCFSSSTSNALFVLFEWFVRWKASGYTAAVLMGVASSICLIKHTAFLCSSYLAFSLYVFCIYAEHSYYSMDTAWAWKKPRFVLLNRLDFHTTDNLSIALLLGGCRYQFQ